MRYTEEDYEKSKEIREIMKDEEWWRPKELSDRLDLPEELIKGVLHWLVGESDQYYRKYELFGIYRGGGGEPEVYFRREVPAQRSLSYFV